MNRKIVSVLLLLLLLGVTAVSGAIAFHTSAETYDVFAYVAENGEVTITGCSSDATGVVVVPDTIEDMPVTKIAKNAFKGKSISGIQLSSNLLSIGESAFEGCSELLEITIPNSVTAMDKYAFYDCNKLETVVIGSGLIRIARYSFGHCDALRSVSLGSVQVIETGAFVDCVALESIDLGDSLETIEYANNYDGRRYGAGAFQACTSLASLTFPDTMKSIAQYAFNNCAELAKLDLGNGVQTIGVSAFDNCDKLTKLHIPDSVTEMGQYAFYDCDRLMELTVGDGLKIIPRYCFADCGKLEYVTLSHVESIWTGAFYNCELLYEVNFGDSLQVLDYNNRYDGRKYGAGAFENCTSLKKAVLPDSLQIIGDNAFYHCSAITSVDLGNGVETIGVNAFDSCVKLKMITIPDSTTSIGKYAFYGCKAIETVTIGSGLEVVPRYCFAYCESLESLTLTHVRVIETGAFYECTFLNSIDWGDSIEKLDYNNSYDGRKYGAGAFENCTRIRTLTIPDTMLEIGGYAFNGCERMSRVTIGNAVKIIGDYAFHGCVNVEEVDFGTSVETLGKDAFESCSKLKAVALPDSVVTIGMHAFANCKSLETFVTGSSTEVIDRFAFAWCTSLKTADIGTALSIGASAFTGCTELTEVNFGDCLEKIIFDSGYDGQNYGGGAFNNCTSLKKLEFPNTLREIGREAFANCTSIQSIRFGNKLNTIGNSAFQGCSSLVEVILPDSLANMGQYAFGYCTALRQVTIGEDLAEVPRYCFAGCTELITVDLGNVSTINTGAFYDCERLCGIIWSSSLKKITFDSGYDGQHWGVGAFENCTCLTSLPLGKNIQTIGERAFQNCSAVEVVRLPYALQTVAKNAFDGCDRLTDVYYMGSEKDMGYVEIQAGNGVIENATMHYEDSADVYKPNGDALYELNASSVQRILLFLFDDTNLKGYYLGTDTDYTKNPFKALNGKIKVVEDSLAEEGIYYLTVVDAAGNVAEISELSVIALTLDGNGGTVADTTVLVLEEMSFILPNATRPGYILVGWSTDPEATEGDFYFEPSEDRTYYAIWEKSEHECEWGEGTVVKEPTCTEPGEMLYTCVSCGATMSEEIPATGHTPGDEPTCTEAQTCEVCGEVLAEALGHTPGEWKVTKEPTCTAEGEKMRSCEVCGTVVSVEGIAATGHTPGDEPTCTEAQTCEVCGEVLAEALGHTPGAWEVVKEPTDTEDGKKVKKCEVCGETLESETIPATGEPNPDHTPGDINGDGRINAKDLTRLIKYLSGDDVDVVEEALDLNGDGRVNMKDYTRLLKYLSGEEVEIY